MIVISNKQKILLLLLFMLLFVGVSAYWYKSINDREIKLISDGTDVISEQTSNTVKDIGQIIDSEPLIYVHVKGAVKRPGVYSLRTGQRVVDAVEVAGGELPDANLDLINLAAKLIDGQEVIIYTSADIDSGKYQSNSNIIDNKININSATKEQLQTLAGIGPAKADAIIKYREKNGNFKDVNELSKVSGIGVKTIENFIDDIVAY